MPSLDALNMISQSPHRSVLSTPSRSLGVPIPLDNCYVPDPLVLSFSSVSNSLEGNNIRYILRNQKVLAKSHFGLGKVLWSVRGVGQDKALFDLVAGTQISIRRVLRAPITWSEGA